MKKFLVKAKNAKSALRDLRAQYGYNGSLRTIQRGRSKANGSTIEEYAKQFRELEAYLVAMGKLNPGSKYEVTWIRDKDGRRRFNTLAFAHGGACQVAKKGKLRVFCIDTGYLDSENVKQVLYIVTCKFLQVPFYDQFQTT